jgi:hypothetical protein
MAQVRCRNGHFYDDRESTTCPHCPVQDLNLGEVKPKVSRLTSPAPPAPGPAPFAHRKTIAIWPGRAEAARPAPGRESRTSSAAEVDPVVGWLVAVEGPAMGRDFRIRWGNNTLGRSPSQAICVAEDEKIHGEEHAFLVYDPKSNRFILRAGSKRGLVYVNENLLVEPVPLEPYSVIQLGASKLVFVPLCGDGFQWSFDEGRQP